MKKMFGSIILSSLLLCTGCGSSEYSNNLANENTLDKVECTKGSGSLPAYGLKLINSAKVAFQNEQLKGSGAIKGTSSVCYSLKWLYNNEYYEVKDVEEYTGSVLIKYDSVNRGYNYFVWISNGTCALENIERNAYDSSTAVNGNNTSNDCGGAVDVIKCTVNDGISECK